MRMRLFISSPPRLSAVHDMRCWGCYACVTLIAPVRDAVRLHLLRCSCAWADGAHHPVITSAAGGVRCTLPLLVCACDAERPVV